MTAHTSAATENLSRTHRTGTPTDGPFGRKETAGNFLISRFLLDFLVRGSERRLRACSGKESRFASSTSATHTSDSFPVAAGRVAEHARSSARSISARAATSVMSDKQSNLTPDVPRPIPKNIAPPPVRRDRSYSSLTPIVIPIATAGTLPSGLVFIERGNISSFIVLTQQFFLYAPHTSDDRDYRSPKQKSSGRNSACLTSAAAPMATEREPKRASRISGSCRPQSRA